MWEISSGVCILFHFPMCLFFITGFFSITAIHMYVLKFGSMLPLALLLFFAVTLEIQSVFFSV